VKKVGFLPPKPHNFQREQNSGQEHTAILGYQSTAPLCFQELAGEGAEMVEGGRRKVSYRHADHGGGRPPAPPSVKEREAGDSRSSPSGGAAAGRRPEEAGEEGLHVC
jgi:hypothetical protein